MSEWREVLIHVRRGDEFLVAHRSPGGGGYWHTIAGGVEPGWEPLLNHEHDEYRWLPREEAAELLHWPEPAAFLRSLP